MDTTGNLVQAIPEVTGNSNRAEGALRAFRDLGWYPKKQ
jgi:hypothetical protein